MVLSPSVSAFINGYNGHTPHLVVSLDKVRDKFRALSASMPEALHHYAIKANPHHDILQALLAEGCRFECASIPEIDMCLAAGAKAKDILYGNPLKKASEIRAAVERGVEQFVFDAELELEKLIAFAPASKVICRINTDGLGAVSPLSIKFGCPPEKAIQWLRRAHACGLVAYGVSFHTGSQQLKPEAWEKPIHDAGYIFKTLEEEGIASLRVLDVGGGFPVPYREEVPPISAFGEVINAALAEAFGEKQPLVYTEPGRYLSGDAGYIIAEVVLVSPCHVRPEHRWVYLDIGRYGGLVEEKIDYPILCNKSDAMGPVLLAGQTCDSNDVIYTDRFGYELPLSLAPGDRVILAHTGVYTTTYSTTLNGFPTLSAQCI